VQAIAEPLVDAYQRLAEAMKRLSSGEHCAVDVASAGSSATERLTAFKTLRARKTETPRVFVSYAREDEETVRTLSKRLTDAGFGTSTKITCTPVKTGRT
jgi:hypothetical protein